MGRRREPGRIRRRLAALLAEKGLIVAPEHLWTQEGGYRHHYWDLARWGTNHARWKDGVNLLTGQPFTLEVQLSSWSKMADCVKYGIELAQEDMSWHVGVESAAPPRAKGQTAPDKPPDDA